VVLLLLCCLPHLALAETSAVTLLQNIANNMIAGLKANKATLKTQPKVVYSLAYQYVVPHADINLMARQVIPPAVWRNATPNQQERFKKAFTTTLIRTYASALSSYHDETVRFYPPRGRGKILEVQSEIHSASRPPINVSYRLVQTNDGWKLIDLSVEGVSMLNSFRSQFSDILAQGNMELLLQRMARKSH
jgi:phospholipid transport system substrate-binding protein